MTPAGLKARDFLKDAERRLLREKVDPWLLALSAGKRLEIADCSGGMIRYEGVTFEGSVQTVFWQFIRPCLEAICAKTFDDFLNEVENYPFPSRSQSQSLDEVHGAARAFVTRVYDRMAVVDQRLRGKGYPDTVKRFDTTRHVQSMNEWLEQRARSILTHHRSLETHPKKSFGRRINDWWKENPLYAKLLYGLAILLVGWIASLLAG